MGSLFEALYKYAAENRCHPLFPEEQKELEECEDMVDQAIEELTANGYGDLAQRIMDGAELLAWFGQRSLFRAGLAIGMELNRL